VKRSRLATLLAEAVRRAAEGTPPASPAAARLDGVWRRYGRKESSR
jgi:hypothetical protein